MLRSLMLSRPQLFLLFTMLAFFVPLLIFSTQMTFIVIVPFTVLVWFAVKWEEITKIERRSSLWEMSIAAGIYAANLVRNAIGFLEGFQGIGLFDMLIAFVAVSVAFYGVKSLKQFILPTAYLAILIVGFQLEDTVTEVAFLENSMAGLITSILNFFRITASVNNSQPNLVMLYSRQGNVYYLLVDAPCTGIKGMLAYGSLAILMLLDIKAAFKPKVLWVTVGVVGTLLVNILRLLAIFFAAYLLEINTALAIHTYLGYSLFIIWVLIFWAVAFKHLLKSNEKNLGTSQFK